MKTVRIALAAALLCSHLAATAADETTITVTNNSPVQRQEVVAIDMKQLPAIPADSIVIINALKQQVDHQTTYDGKLLLDVAVQPYGKAVYKVSKGTPQKPITYCYGRAYDFRKDDIAWENDRIGFRVYGPKFQRDGDIGYGIDVWIKNTPDLVVEMFYNDNCFHKKSFHLDHGYGCDCYNVGASLGCGTPTLLHNGKMMFPYCYESYEILDNGPLRFTVRLDFAPTVVGKDTKVVEHRIISLDKGSNFCKAVVWYDGIADKHDLAIGIVLHDASKQTLTDKERLLYADPTGAAEKHNFQIYTGVLFPNGGFKTKKEPYTEPLKGVYGHLTGTLRGYTGSAVTYYFGAAWSKYDVRTFDEWKLRSAEHLSAIRNPLRAEITPAVHQ